MTRPAPDSRPDRPATEPQVATDVAPVPPEPPQWMPRRRTVVIAAAVLLALILGTGGVTAYAQRAPDTAVEVVEAFLEAARDGDADRAANWWMDLEGTRGGMGLRERIRAYVVRWHSRYEEALDGTGWTLTAGGAGGLAVEVSVNGRRATYLVVGADEDLRIALGPEDRFGQSAGYSHPLFVGN